MLDPVCLSYFLLLWKNTMTKATRRRLRLQAVGVHHDRKLWQQVAGMAGGTAQARSREISKLSPVTHFSPASLYLLNLPKQCHQRGDQVFTSKLMQHILRVSCMCGSYVLIPTTASSLQASQAGVLRTLSSRTSHYEASLSRYSHLRDVYMPFLPMLTVRVRFIQKVKKISERTQSELSQML